MEAHAEWAEQSAQQLAQLGVSIELIDVQTLLPFDLNHSISKSLERTNKVVFLDEDVSGGATAYMMQKVLVETRRNAPLGCRSVNHCLSRSSPSLWHGWGLLQQAECRRKLLQLFMR